MNPSKFLDASYTEFEARLTELEDAFAELLKGSFPSQRVSGFGRSSSGRRGGLYRGALHRG